MDKVNISETAIKKTMSYRYAIFFVIAVAYFTVYFHRVLTSVMAPELMKAFEIGATSLGLFGSMYLWAYAAGQLPAGIAADRLGIRMTMAIFVAVSGCGALIIGFADSFHTALAGRFLVGFGVSFVYVPAMRFLADWFKSNEFATCTGALLAIGNIGALAAAAPLVTLMAWVGWRGSMKIVGIGALVTAALCFLIIRNRPADIGGASPDQMEGRPETRASSTCSIMQAIGMTAKNWNVWTVIIMFSCWYGTVMAFQGLWAAPWLMSAYGMTEAEAGRIVSMIPIGMIVGCPLAGYVSDKIIKSRFRVMLTGIVATTLCWVILVFMVDRIPVRFLYILLLIYGFVNGSFVLSYANLKEHVEPSIQGTATGFLNTIVVTGAAAFMNMTSFIVAAAPVVGGIIPTYGLKRAFIFCLCSLIAASLVFMTQKRPAPEDMTQT
jgi:sugar phosphate permease